jgi:hypothetical protein
VQGLVLVSADGFLAQHGGGAHHGDGDDERVVRHFLRVEQGDRPAFPDGTDGDQLADIGIAPAARAEQRGAERDVFNFLDVDCTQGSVLLSTCSAQACLFSGHVCRRDFVFPEAWPQAAMATSSTALRRPMIA